MKRTLTLIAAILLLAAGATAQKLSYSAVVRNGDNQLVANTNMTVEISIANSSTGNPVYAETHTAQTNPNGLVTLTIGDGTDKTGNLSNVTWPTAFITTDYTLPGGAQVVNTVPVNAVPYALYADLFSPESILNAVGAMTPEQKAALRQALGITTGDGN